MAEGVKDPLLPQLIQSLAWELPYVVGATKKKKKKRWGRILKAREPSRLSTNFSAETTARRE